MNAVRMVFLFCAVSGAAYGQSYQDSLLYAESVWSSQKRLLFMQILPPDYPSKTAFLSFYDSYSRATKALELEYFSLMRKHQAREGNADKSFARLLRVDKEIAKARKDYFKKLSRAFSPKIASDFMAADNNFRLYLRKKMQEVNFRVGKLNEDLYTRR